MGAGWVVKVHGESSEAAGVVGIRGTLPMGRKLAAGSAAQAMAVQGGLPPRTLAAAQDSAHG